ncbi:hypothetical protein B0T17DRAFT_616789 [Bombardia bombarda]|uniref:Uncharacterized protein n=1 Tax=Bombardia bombarda TaxID=252184 RepID=A0AA39WZQ1_9PEZI|nr:hypothetical protein B0T17DRAFT_616789 [Bombardia bombarda]
MQIEALMARMSSLLSRIATPANFPLKTPSDQTKFNDTLVSWLTDPSSTFPNGSIVGLCCSSLLSIHFRDETVDADLDLLPEFQSFLLATSLAHSGWNGGGKDGSMGRRDLCTAGHVSGYRLMKRLDRILTPQFLGRCSPEYCQVLFLLVLGTVLGVGYSSDLAESPSFPPDLLGERFQQSPTLWLAMKEHLCQMLAHHLIFLGSMLGIKLDTALERQIIDTAVDRWNKMEAFVWADGVLPPAMVASGEPDRSPVSSSRSNSSKSSGSKRPMSIIPSPVAKNESINLPYWEELPPPVPLPLSTLVPIPCPPEVAQLRGAQYEKWTENPQSYLSMEDEIITPCAEPDMYEDRKPSASTSVADQGMVRMMPMKSNTEPIPTGCQEVHVPWRKVRTRSMWVVRTIDAGEQGQINVHARLRGREVDDFGVFV